VKTREAELLQRELEGVRKLWLIAIGPNEPREIMEPDLTRVQGEQGLLRLLPKYRSYRSIGYASPSWRGFGGHPSFPPTKIEHLTDLLRGFNVHSRSSRRPIQHGPRKSIPDGGVTPIFRKRLSIP
jgi:hypothetical protein